MLSEEKHSSTNHMTSAGPTPQKIFDFDEDEPNCSDCVFTEAENLFQNRSRSRSRSNNKSSKKKSSEMQKSGPTAKFNVNNIQVGTSCYDCPSNN